MSKTYEIELVDNIEYSSRGNTEKAMFIQISAPKAKQSIQCAELKQSFYISTKEISDNTNEKSSGNGEGSQSELTAADIIVILHSSKQIDIKKLFLHAKELLTSGVCLLDGEVNLTKPLYDELSHEDVEKLLGAYLLNFILKSVLAQ